MKKKNLIGRQVSRLRYQRAWTREMLADKLQLTGWMISRSGVSKIEGGSMYVPDFRLFYFARAFKVEFTALFPKASSPIHKAVLRFDRIEPCGMAQQGAEEPEKQF